MGQRMMLESTVEQTLTSGTTQAPPPGVIERIMDNLLGPRLIACVAGAYPGNLGHALRVALARDVIRTTRTNACIAHFPRKRPRRSISIPEFIDSFVCPESVVALVNTSRAVDSVDALNMVRVGLRFFCDPSTLNLPLVKLEILDGDLNVVPDQMLACLRAMTREIRARTIPLLPPDAEIVACAIELGCPAVRILVGRIGKNTGILNERATSDAIIAAQGKPTILEGGLHTANDVFAAARLGATAVLVNSAFALTPDPRSKALELRKAADIAWGSLQSRQTIHV
jgi:thiazole synthase ThiGH ThiG subunit